MSHLPIEETHLFQQVKAVANEVWREVNSWEGFPKRSLGLQLTSSLDSLGANLVEGDGRYSDAEALHFFTIARGSLREAVYWLGLARDRELLRSDKADDWINRLSSCRGMLNAQINYRRSSKNKNMVKEELAIYSVESRHEPDVETWEETAPEGLGSELSSRHTPRATRTHNELDASDDLS